MMGLFDKLFGKKPAVVIPTLTPEEQAAQRAKYIDNIVWSVGDEMSRFPGWIVAQYAKGKVPEYDASTPYLERARIEEAIEQVIGEFRKLVPEPEAQAQIDKIKSDALERTMRLLHVVPSGGIGSQ